MPRKLSHMYNSSSDSKNNTNPLLSSEKKPEKIIFTENGTALAMTDEDRATIAALECPDNERTIDAYRHDFRDSQTILANLLKVPAAWEIGRHYTPGMFEDYGHQTIFKTFAALVDSDGNLPPVNVLEMELKERISSGEKALFVLGELEVIKQTEPHNSVIGHMRRCCIDQKGKLLIATVLDPKKSMEDKLRVLRDGADEVLSWQPESAGDYCFAPISATEFYCAEFVAEWLVKGVLVKGQPCLVGGPKKALKTSVIVDLALSLGSGTKFLDTFTVPRPVRTLVISGESGGSTLKETALRIAESKGIDLRDTLTFWDFRLPQLSVNGQLRRLTNGLKEKGIEVVIIDPLYLCLLSGQSEKKQRSAANLYDMGELLSLVSNACLEAGATPILIHHTKKSAEFDTKHKPLDLEDLAFAGVGEFARQWLLLNRREKFVPGTGRHYLHLTYGGSAGHSGQWGLDVDEGTIDECFAGRTWKVSLVPHSQVIVDDKARKHEKKEEAKFDSEHELRVTMVNAVRLFKMNEGDYPKKTKLRDDILRWNNTKFKRVYNAALNQPDGVVNLDGKVQPAGALKEGDGG